MTNGSITLDLKYLGLTDWLKAQLSPGEFFEDNLARIVAVNKDSYHIRNKDREMLANLTGKIVYGAESNLDLPTVGDWVQVEYFNDHTLAIIRKILPRKSLLKRKMAGKQIDYQLIAANIDIAFIVQSLDFNFNIPRLERYLTMVNDSNIQPVILLSKQDLTTPELLAQKIAEITGMNHSYPIIGFSNNTGAGLEEIKALIKPGLTYCLLGSSGVGKTTLLNRLIGEDVYVTQGVREKDSRGRHATARRHLTVLEGGGLIIDNPGMRELGNFEVHAGLTETFADIQKWGQSCRFNNCTHTNEPGCSVLEALRHGDLDEGHYQNYLKLKKETEHYEMSYIERRKKDKKFGKMCKQVMKNYKKGSH